MSRSYLLSQAESFLCEVEPYEAGDHLDFLGLLDLDELAGAVEELRSLAGEY